MLPGCVYTQFMSDIVTVRKFALLGCFPDVLFLVVFFSFSSVRGIIAARGFISVQGTS